MLQGFQPLQLAGRGNAYGASAFLTAPSAWNATTGLGGPLIWNGSNAGGGKGVTAYILSVSWGFSSSSNVPTSIGICTGATTAPTSTTAIDSVANLYQGGQSPQCSAYRVGTVSAAATFFLPIGRIHTGAITVDTDDDNFIHLGGAIVIPPGSFFSISPWASLAAATPVLQAGCVWLEISND